MTDLDAGKVTILGGHVHGSVSVLVNLVQGDGLFLHELKEPQQDLLLETQTKRETERTEVR